MADGAQLKSSYFSPLVERRRKFGPVIPRSRPTKVRYSATVNSWRPAAFPQVAMAARCNQIPRLAPCLHVVHEAGQIRMVVVLPAPLGPRNANTSPLATEKVTGPR